MQLFLSLWQQATFMELVLSEWNGRHGECQVGGQESISHTNAQYHVLESF